MSEKHSSTTPSCDSCGGTGQLNFFKGESRFLLTAEECPYCNGVGYILPEEDASGKPAQKKMAKGKRRK